MFTSSMVLEARVSRAGADTRPGSFLAKMAQEGIGLRKSSLIDIWLPVSDFTNIEQRFHEDT